jgi:hypothetical protein
MKKIIIPLFVTLLAIGLNFAAKAQSYTYTTATAMLTEGQFNTLTTSGSIKLVKVGEGQYEYDVSQVQDEGPDCIDTWTPSEEAYWQNLANTYCMIYYPCRQKEDCSIWMMKVIPTDPECLYVVQYVQYSNISVPNVTP